MRNNPALGWTVIGIFAVGAWLAFYLFGWIALGTYVTCCIVWRRLQLP